ncbi:MAG: FHA domain-containing protein [Spirosomataceae bacterium]
MQVILIGRGTQPVAGQVVLNSRGVSGQHAKAVIDSHKNTIVLEDLGSTNGTFVNGFRIKRKNISHNDVIMIADQRLSLQQIFDASRSMRSDPNDYSVEFAKLQDVWDKYQVLLKQARSNNGMDTFMTVCLIVAPALLLGPIAGAVVAGGAIGGTMIEVQ